MLSDSDKKHDRFRDLHKAKVKEQLGPEEMTDYRSLVKELGVTLTADGSGVYRCVENGALCKPGVTNCDCQPADS
jgi:hypothetical protein